jgi:hypothetical protein
MCPTQSGKSLRQNLSDFEAEVCIDPLKMRNVRRKVAKFRADLTFQQRNNLKIDNSFGSLVHCYDSKWFPTLMEAHNIGDGGFHFQLFEPLSSVGISIPKMTLCTLILNDTASLQFSS